MLSRVPGHRWKMYLVRNGPNDHKFRTERFEAGEAFSSLGGMNNLKRWLTQRRGSWEDSAREFGLEPPHGVIILGVQGCGKSLCAQAVAGEWNLPLVKFDTAAVYDKYIGETEKRTRKVFHVAEGLAVGLRNRAGPSDAPVSL